MNPDLWRIQILPNIGAGIPLTAPPPAWRDALQLSASPNPSHGDAEIGFTCAKAAQVRLSIMDVQGREIARLVERVVPAGRHRVEWNAATSHRVRAGVYLVRCESAGVRSERKLVLVQ